MNKLVLFGAIAGLSFFQFTRDTLAQVPTAGLEAHPACLQILQDKYSAKIELLNLLITLRRQPNHPDRAGIESRIKNLFDTVRALEEHWLELGCENADVRLPPGYLPKLPELIID